MFVEIKIRNWRVFFLVQLQHRGRDELRTSLSFKECWPWINQRFFARNQYVSTRYYITTLYSAKVSNQKRHYQNTFLTNHKCILIRFDVNNEFYKFCNYKSSMSCLLDYIYTSAHYRKHYSISARNTRLTLFFTICVTAIISWGVRHIDQTIL